MHEAKNHAASDVVLDDVDKNAIEAGLAQVLIKRQQFSSCVSFLGFGFMAWVMRDVVSVHLLELWVGSLLVMEMLNLWFVGRLKKVLDSSARRWRWLHGLTVYFYFLGVAWGSGAVLPGLQPNSTVFLMMTVGMVTVGLFAIHNLSTHWPILLTFCLGLATPQWMAGALEPVGGQQMMWALSAVVVVVMLQLYGFSAYTVHRHDIEGDVARRKLAQKLEQSNQELAQALERVQLLATIDPLTQCLNRRALMDALHQEERRRARSPTSVGVVMLDLDHFKSINDNHGHDVGDAVLVAVAARVKAQLRETDLLARWGGEEFLCVLMPVHEDSLLNKAQDMCTRLAQTPVLREPEPLTVTASVGVALWNDEESVQACIQRADAALYRAKRTGRNRVCQ